MSDKFSRRCGYPSCTKYPLYGVEGTKKAEYCARHARDGLVSVVGKRCAHGGCSKHPSYGFEERRIKEFCAPHAKEGMAFCMTWARRCSFGGSGVGVGGGEHARRPEEADSTIRLGGGLSARLRTRSVAFGEMNASMVAGGGNMQERTKQARLVVNSTGAPPVDGIDPVKEEAQLDDR